MPSLTQVTFSAAPILQTKYVDPTYDQVGQKICSFLSRRRLPGNAEVLFIELLSDVPNINLCLPSNFGFAFSFRVSFSVLYCLPKVKALFRCETKSKMSKGKTYAKLSRVFARQNALDMNDSF